MANESIRNHAIKGSKKLRLILFLKNDIGPADFNSFWKFMKESTRKSADELTDISGMSVDCDWTYEIDSSHSTLSEAEMGADADKYSFVTISEVVEMDFNNLKLWNLARAQFSHNGPACTDFFPSKWWYEYVVDHLIKLSQVLTTTGRVEKFLLQ